VEAIGAIIACGAALAFGVFAGSRWAPGPVLGALMGFVVGTVVAPAYFIAALLVGAVRPQLLDAHRVGLLAMALVIAGALCGSIGAWFGYRKSLGAKLF